MMATLLSCLGDMRNIRTATAEGWNGGRGWSKMRDWRTSKFFFFFTVLEKTLAGQLNLITRNIPKVKL